MGKKLFLVDAEKCTGCALCVVACKDEHVGHSYLPWTGPQPDTGHFWVDVRGLERGNIPRVAVSHLPVFCQHCENAACLKACPDNAIFRREDGLVWIDESACSGCGLCVEACPYDAIFMNETRAVAQKCTGCAHRVDEGLEPRCAEICPHEAIVFGEASDIFSDRDASQEDWGGVASRIRSPIACALAGIAHAVRGRLRFCRRRGRGAHRRRD